MDWTKLPMIVKWGYAFEWGERYPVFLDLETREFVTYDPDGEPGELCPCRTRVKFGRRPALVRKLARRSRNALTKKVR